MKTRGYSLKLELHEPALLLKVKENYIKISNINVPNSNAILSYYF